MSAAPPPPRLFVVLGQLPTQAILFVFAVLITAATAAVVIWRIAHGQPVGNLGEWFLFCGALLGIERAGFVGKRQTEWKPEEVARAAVIAGNAPPVEITTGPPTATVAPAPPAQRVGPLTPMDDDPDARG